MHSSIRTPLALFTAAISLATITPWMHGEDATSVPQRIARYPEDAAFPGRGPLRSQMDWFRQLWSEKRSQWWRDREKDRGAVVFLGDSITQGWGTLAQDFPSLKVANRGISGDLTRGVLYRLQDDVLDLNPRAVVLLIGTNDLEDGGTPEVIADNVAAILTACQRHDARMPVIVCKVMPSSASMRRPADKIQRINALVDARLKDFPQAVRCDTWTPFADARGDAKAAEFPDLLHPNAAGYAKFAEALRPVLAKLPPAK
jgi:lysophospholipase L1-like esterase